MGKGRDHYKDGPCCGQVIPGSPTDLIVKRLIAGLDAEHFPSANEPRGYRVISDASGYPLPSYDAPAIGEKRKRNRRS